MFYIEDGKGSGNKVGVTNENRLMSECITLSGEHHTNHHNGEAYNLLYSDDTADNTYFMYMKNTSDNYDISFEGIDVRSAANVVIEVRIVTGTASGTEATPANLNCGAGNEADGDFYIGTVAGLTNRTILQRYWVAAGNESNHFNFEQDIIVSRGQAIALYTETADGSALGVTANFNYHNIEGI